MAERTVSLPNAAPYTVRHVDGVMHLTLQPQAESQVLPETLRVQPPLDEPAEA